MAAKGRQRTIESTASGRVASPKRGRGVIRNPIAILAADLHLRDDQPTCRTDDYWSAQERKIDFITTRAREFHCPILVAGDFFHHWKPSPYLLAWSLRKFDGVRVITVPGNHDLPQNNLDLIRRTGLQVLSDGGGLDILSGGRSSSMTPFIDVYGWAAGEDPEDRGDKREKMIRIAIWHELVWKGRRPFPGCSSPATRKVLERLRSYDLVLTGDNHQTILDRSGERILVNPGSMMRMTASQMDHEPKVFLLFGDGSVDPLLLPYDPDVVTREHIERPKDRDQKLEAFVRKLKEDGEVGLSFEENLREFLSRNRTRKEVRSLLDQAMEEDGVPEAVGLETI